MAYLDALRDAQRQITQRNVLIVALMAMLAISTPAWLWVPKNISVDVRPGLSAVMRAKPGEMPAENVFNFGLTLLQQIYRWRTDGSEDYTGNLRTFGPFLTEPFARTLAADAEQRLNAGELRARTRVWEPVEGSYFSAERVQVVDARTWLITLDADITEAVSGQTVKSGAWRYEVYVQAIGADRDINPYGLRLAGFKPGTPTKLEATTTPTQLEATTP